MRLQPLDPSTLEVAAAWMARKENYQWLDFGSGVQVLTSVALRVMARRDLHLLRTFSADDAGAPIGLVVLSDISPPFRTATLWYVLGDKAYAGQGHTTRAVSAMLTLGFTELGLHAVSAWAVEHNTASIAVLKRNNFQLVGRQRQCHRIDDRPFDRLLFDLLASEHRSP